jgi:hypothetical protein
MQHGEILYFNDFFIFKFVGPEQGACIFACDFASVPGAIVSVKPLPHPNLYRLDLEFDTPEICDNCKSKPVFGKIGWHEDASVRGWFCLKCHEERDRILEGMDDGTNR